MKKKAVSALLCAAMVAECLQVAEKEGFRYTVRYIQGGCVKRTESASSNLKDDGKVLNIYCWNEEFKSRTRNNYPDYKEADATHGKKSRCRCCMEHHTE